MPIPVAPSDGAFRVGASGAVLPAAGGTKLHVTHEMGHPALYSTFAKGYSDAWPRALRRLAEYLAPKTLEKA